MSPVPNVEAATPFLQIKRVVKQFDDVFAVDDVSLNIEKGEIFALLGSSGSGKSTLLRILAGFEVPSAGQIILEGRDIVGLAPYERPINMMFQSYALFPHLSVWDNVAFGLRRDGLPKAEIEERVGKMLDLVMLKAYAKRKPHQLSGGQQQRVALARSLAKRPRLLLLDEPMGALDRKLRERTQLELVGIIEQVGVTCVMVTHDQEEAMNMAHRIALMDAGHIRQVGTPDEIYEQPTSRFAAEFIGSLNVIEGKIEDDESDFVTIRSEALPDTVYIGHGISGFEGQQVAFAVRPEKVTISKDQPDQKHNKAQGIVEDIAYYGSHSVYHVRLPSGFKIMAHFANRKRWASENFTWNDPVWVSWGDDAGVVLTT